MIIEILKIDFLAYSYSRKYKIKLGSDKELYSNKRLNDYNAPRA
jgi:hypothetical protein